MVSYFYQIWRALGGVFIALSKLLNSVLGGRHDQTFSARVGAAQKAGERWAKIVAPVLALGLSDPDHAEEAARNDE